MSSLTQAFTPKTLSLALPLMLPPAIVSLAYAIYGNNELDTHHRHQHHLKQNGTDAHHKKPSPRAQKEHELSLTQEEPMWVPHNTDETAMNQFRLRVNAKYGLVLANYEELRQWSIDNISQFWATVWEFTNIIHSVPYEQVLDETKPIDSIPEWFKGARLNLAENLLWQKDDHTAIIFTGEGHKPVHVTYHQLRQSVAKCSAALRNMGVKKGDRVCGYIANCVEAVVAMLATATIGAIWSSTSPDFGITGVLERFTQTQPKVIFSVNAVVYNGKVHDHLVKLREVIHNLKELEKIVIVRFVEDAGYHLHGLSNAVVYDDFLSTGLQSDGSIPPLQYEQVPFNHPAYILFSSGTTGQPKCIVHSVGGPLIQHKKEHILHSNISSHDVFFQYTTTGWMMWNFLLGVLSTGATIVLFDGSPFKPDPLYLWRLVDELKITVFGTSAKYIASLQDAGVKPRESCNLSSLRMILSTGSPLKPESFDYVYSDIKSDVNLGSITGGTDIVSLFAGNNVTLPVYRGEIQCRNLGMKVESWTAEGTSVIGEEGDLVCTKPFPCMPVYFWNDPDGSKYHKAYFSQFKGVWYHGDFLVINPATGGVIMLGRSDGTLNPSGVRIGTAEIYNVVEKFSDVVDSLVVGQKYQDDERVILFLKMAQEKKFTEELAHDIKKEIRVSLSPRHVPAVIVPIAEIPYTINGKKVEVAVKRIISGEKVIPSGALADPKVLDLFYNIPELQ